MSPALIPDAPASGATTDEEDPPLSALAGEEPVPIPPELVSGAAGGPLSEGQARLWALVLHARAVPCHLRHDGEGWTLLVPPTCRATAVTELRLFEEENRHWPPPDHPLPPLAGETLATLSVLLLLAIFHNITRLDLTPLVARTPDWTGLGEVHAALIREGEWWRLVTALTLHAGVVHLLGNLAIGGIFALSLCRDLGSGLAWCLILGSGALGNLLNSLIQAPDHRSLGASTAVFGAVGILAAAGIVRSRHNRGTRRYLPPAAAALALLALLGTEGKETDLGAHLCGFLSGLLLGGGAVLTMAKRGRPGRRLTLLLALLAALIVVWAWDQALATPRS